ncbi:insulinase family protein [Candidatus Pelagibacter sp.]|nr:insulinase family protein [Candidatus Pelagibacter sp.]
MKKTLPYLLIITLFTLSVKANDFPLDPNITYGKLDNNLTYYIRENQKPKDKAYIKMVIKAGSVMEEEHQQGLAHLLEHMAFNGSKNFPKRSIDEFMSSIGLNIGTHYNASTGFFTTNYEYEIPTNDSKNLETVIKIFADILKNLSLEDDAFERERKIVEEEWRGDIGSDQKYLDALYEVTHKNSLLEKRKPIGKIEVIRNFKYQDVKEFYKKWYQPEITALFVAGDIDTNKTIKLIEDNFSYFENTAELNVLDYSIPDFNNNRFISYQDKDFDSVLFSIWEKHPFQKINNFNNYKEKIIDNLIYQIIQRRINEQLEKDQLDFVAAGIYSQNISNKDKYKISIVSLNEKNINEGITDFLRFIEQINRYGFLKSELDLAKKNEILSLEQNIIEDETRSSKSYVNEYMRHFTSDEMISGPEKELEYIKDIHALLDVNDLNNYFRKYTAGNNQILSLKAPDYIQDLPNENKLKVLIAKIKKEKVEPYEFELKETVLIDDDLKGSKIIKKKKYPKTGVIELTLANGPKIFLKQTNFEKDSISLTSFSSGGTSKANEKILPSAKVTDSILAKADIGNLSVSEKENLYPLDLIDVYPNISEKGESMIGYTNNAFKEDMFKLLYLNFTDLRVKDIHVDQFIKNELNEYNISKQSPKYSYEVEFKEKLYNNHPRVKFKTDEIIKKINLKDVKNFYKDRYYDGGNFNFYIVGDFKFDEIEPLLEKYIGSLPKIDRVDEYIDHGIRHTKDKHELIYKEEDPKKAGVTRIYFKEFNSSIKERFKFNLLFSVADKMLHDVVREKNNLVYSITMSKYFDQFKPIEMISFYTYFGSDPENVETIKKKIDEVFEDIKNKEFDQKIMIDQKTMLINSFKENLRSNKYWLTLMEYNDQYNQNLERFMNIELIIKSITAQDISRLAKKYLDDKYFRDIQLTSE